MITNTDKKASHILGDALISVDQVIEKIGMSRGWIWRAEREGRFPRGLPLGRAKRWRLSDVDCWIAAQ